MDINDEYLLGFLGLIFIAGIAQHQRVRRKRRYKTRFINRNRNKLGFYQATFLPMKEHDAEDFFAYTRMSVPMFEQLLSMVTQHIRKRGFLRDSINVEMRLAITLQYLSQGVSMRSLAWSYQIGRTTAHKIIKECCIAIWDVLSVKYLKPKNKTEWKAIAKDFFRKWNFPNCIGALDGKHIQIEAPPNSGSLFYNYKSTFSIVLMALCDANYLFTCVDVGAFGSQHDGGIFSASIFGQRFEKKLMDVPADENIPNTNITMPFVITADEAFPLKRYIQRPYPGRQLTIRKKIYNYRLSRARRVIDNTFGILVARWRLLRKTIQADVSNVDHFVKATICLHNFCKMNNIDKNGNSRYCPAGYVDQDDQDNGGWRREVTPLSSVGRLGSNNAQLANFLLRDRMADYFESPIGALPWQLERVMRGRRTN